MLSHQPVENTIFPPIDVPLLLDEIQEIIASVLAAEQNYQDVWKSVAPHYQESAKNLLHYLALRAFDLQHLQEKLSMLSLSSLGHSEGYTLTNLRQIRQLLLLIQGHPVERQEDPFQSPLHYYRSRQQLAHNTLRLFGEGRHEHGSKIMVTMDTEAAYDERLLVALLEAGMDVARINTSHDTPELWQRMIDHLRRAEQTTGRTCRIYMDLAGPKLRTQKIDPIHARVDKKNRDYLQLRDGDLLRVVKELPQVNLADANFEYGPSHVTVTLAEIFDDVRQHQKVFFDDGKIEGEIIETDSDAFTVKIIRSGIKGARLRSDKGVNLPDTLLRLPSLTADDYANLPFIVTHADMVGYSFVRTPQDVERLQQQLRQAGREDIGVILKIETREAFENLPKLLLTAMRSPQVGVMIARGDLAVEMGFERISEVQEEILWLCEAAHIPGIWATQVLDTLATEGLATRAEITDAAMAGRAECIMLNKGPYIVEAVAALDDILRRMERHQFKRKSNLRPLQVARRFLGMTDA